MYKNILILSTPDINQASGIIAYDLCIGLRTYTNCNIMVYASKSDDAISYSNKLIFYKKKFVEKLKSKLGLTKIKTDPKYYFFDINQRRRLINQKRLNEHMNNVDLVIAYFANKFFTPYDLYEIQRIYGVPIVLIMADLIHITGGCHFSWDCTGYTKVCESCPAILNDKYKGIAKKNLMHTQFLYTKMDLKLIALSGKDYEKAVQSTLFRDKPVKHIFGGIDRTVFRRKDNYIGIRNYYDLLPNEFTILFAASHLTEERKGFQYFLEVLSNYKKYYNNKDITVVLIGKDKAASIVKSIGFKVLSLGYISSYNKLSEIFNMVDLFCVTSVQDSGPMMINQSICCGTPVLTFDIGVASDLIIHGKTGFVIETKDTLSFSKSLHVMRNMSFAEKKLMSDECLILAEKYLDRNIVAKNVLDFALE